jgi:hypothetical protein
MFRIHKESGMMAPGKHILIVITVVMAAAIFLNHILAYESLEERNHRETHELAKLCILKNGDPKWNENGTLKGCNYNYKLQFDKNKHE